jgi:hypothetical protein
MLVVNAGGGARVSAPNGRREVAGQVPSRAPASPFRLLAVQRDAHMTPKGKLDGSFI